jgi:hypothetical protein
MGNSLAYVALAGDRRVMWVQPIGLNGAATEMDRKCSGLVLVAGQSASGVLGG